MGSLLWRHAGALHCTALVKATFSLPSQGIAQRLNPQPIRRHDDYLSGRPSLAGASEIAPHAEQAEVVLVGHAYAYGDPITSRSVRLTVVRGQKILIDKTLFIYGDRVKKGEPKAFQKMRIGYERALGGLTFEKNPVGVGLEDDSSRLPNILDARSRKRNVGGFGPIPARFPRRRTKRGKVPLEDIENGIAEYPDHFDWGYFATAQRDQRTDRLEGHEWIMLEGLHPEAERVRVRLPHVVGRVRVFGARGGGIPDEVKMRAQLLHLEPDEGRCSLVWRGSFPVASERVAESLVIAGAAHVAGEELSWPDDTGNVEGIASPAANGAPRRAAPPVMDFSATMFSAGVDVELPPELLDEPPEAPSPPRISNTVPPPPLSHVGQIPEPGPSAPSPSSRGIPSETGETEPTSQPDQHWPAFLPPSSGHPYAYQPPSTARHASERFEHTEMILDEGDLEVIHERIPRAHEGEPDMTVDDDLIDTIDENR